MDYLPPTEIPTPPAGDLQPAGAILCKNSVTPDLLETTLSFPPQFFMGTMSGPGALVLETSREPVSVTVTLTAKLQDSSALSQGYGLTTVATGQIYNAAGTHFQDIGNGRVGKVEVIEIIPQGTDDEGNPLPPIEEYRGCDVEWQHKTFREQIFQFRPCATGWINTSYTILFHF